ncbi:MAG: NfeD family protein [Prevotella sp.]|nr:NfeD family protein [Prevotella sp.]
MIEFLAQHLWQMWAVIAVLCLISELTSGDFFIFCFSIGAACASVCAAYGANFYWQLFIFAVFTLVSIFTVRPVALRWLHRNDQHRVSNADALIGRRGKVVEPIEANGYGRVAIDGDVWKAQTAGELAVAVGQYVKVVSRQSTIITVEPEILH